MQNPRWRASAIATAAAVLLGISASAHALSLGRVTVQSALGEPLRAEIDISEVSAEELNSLKTNIATPDAFRAAGMEFNPALTGVKITLERRPDGRHILNLTSSRAVTDPFLDLILETQWASGRIVRDYTMLFDPPSARQSQAPLAAQIAPSPSKSSPQARPSASASTTPPSGAQQAASSRAAPSNPATTSRSVATSGEAKQVTVRSGDTAGKIAASNRSGNISLDQMLVAMLRANPDAFTGGNVNRLRAGAVLDMPTAEQAAQVSPTEAAQALVAQSRDFNEFRRHLAETVPATHMPGADRQSSGKVTAQVDDRKSTASAPDKLTLSKASAQAGKSTASEDKIARDRAAQDTAQRVAELSKNIGDLNRIGGATASASNAKPTLALPVGGPANAAKSTASAVASSAAAKPASIAAPAIAAPAASTVSATAAVKSASAPTATASASNPQTTASAAAAPASMPVASASAPVSAASGPVAVASTPAKLTPAQAAQAVIAKPKPKAAPAMPAETSLLDDLLDNPLIPGGVGAALLALIGLGAWRFRQHRKSTQVDSSFLESRLQPDSFFGASGGQRIDTNEGTPTGSSMVYSPSQLDAAGDVDPVAEADVYLAYGRDLQAEEILKEALRVNPQRVAIHAKLLEIYAKRRDTRAFEVIAADAHRLTQGDGPEWLHICDLGQELDPTNPLYRPGGQPNAAGVTGANGKSSDTFGSAAAVQSASTDDSADADIDLDLDFSIGDEPAAASPARTEAPVAAPVNLAATQPLSALDLDFGTAPHAAPSTEPAMLDLTTSQSEPATLDAPDLTLDKNSLNFDLPSIEEPVPAVATSNAGTEKPGMIEFDLGALSLDLPSSKPMAAAPVSSTTPAPTLELDEVASTGGLSTGFDADGSDDPLATKLALAQEFNAIGDPDGARSLAQEVIAEASGDLKSRAQRFLAEIS